MRKHGWQLPYHPLQVLTFSLLYVCGVWEGEGVEVGEGSIHVYILSSGLSNLRILQTCVWFRYLSLQVVAVAVFLALGFAFYVFFAPFVGKKLFQYIVMGLYTPLVSHLEFFVFSFVFHICILSRQWRTQIYLLAAISVSDLPSVFHCTFWILFCLFLLLPPLSNFSCSFVLNVGLFPFFRLFHL